MTIELKGKITDIINANREICADGIGWEMPSHEIAEKIAEVVDAENDKALLVVAREISDRACGYCIASDGCKEAKWHDACIARIANFAKREASR